MLPEGFAARMRALLGSEYGDFLASFDRPLCTGLRKNPLKAGFTGDLSRFSLAPVPWCPTGFYYDAASRPGLSPYHAAGLYYLQEPSAMAPAELLDPQPGERVLDLCAAPGGKSTQLAGKLLGKGLLVCNEINAKRAKILSGNMERLGISNALVLNEHPKKLTERFAGYFDKILVDAPCSGEGMFRKDPTAIAEWSPEHVSACAKRQQQILESACRCVAPGGKLIYSTCTFSREENEDVIEEFCRMHPEFTVEMQHRLYPHTCCGEGHFAARLQRNRSSFPDTSAFTASAESACTAQKKAGTRSGRAKRSDCIPDAVAVPRIKDKAEIAALTEFLRDSFLDFSDESRLNEFLREIRRMSDGRIVYAPFTFHENLLRLRILSLGVEVGELLKGRFKPCHSFFVACHGLHFRNEIDFSSESDELRRYLSGNTVPVPVNMRGFAAVSVDGCTLGFGKAVDGVLKNHFPKGLAVAAFR